MPDQLFDLFDSVARELDREVDLVLPAAPPQTVRRDVESRRRRRTVVTVAVVLLLTLAVASTVYAKVFRTGATPNWATSPTGTPTTTAVAPASPGPSGVSRPPQSPPAVTTLTSPLPIKAESDLDGIAWLSVSGRAFLASEFQRHRTASGCNNEGYVVLTAYRGDDLVAGEAAGCDSGRITWGSVRGIWRVVAAGHAVPTCFEVQSSGWESSIPEGFIGAQCHDDSRRLVAYTPGARVQPVVAAGDVLTMLGIGELTIGMTRADLVARVIVAPVGSCGEANPVPTLASEGIAISSVNETVTYIVVQSSQHSTQSGARVGMTMGQVKQIYGDKVSVKTVTLEIGDPQGNTRQAYVISSGNTLVFLSDSRQPIAANDVLTGIYLLRGSTVSLPAEFC